MKKIVFRVAGMLALAFMAATQMARAQEPVVANIPFAFTVGNKMLPSGEYRVEKWIKGDSALLIQRTDGGAATFAGSIATDSNEPQTKTKLVFHRYGDQYFLSQVWVEGSSRGRQIPKSKQEKEQEQLLARNETRDEVTIVASLTPPKR
jgi:hypothetical protein